MKTRMMNAKPGQYAVSTCSRQKKRVTNKETGETISVYPPPQYTPWVIEIRNFCFQSPQGVLGLISIAPPL